jgi:hypothetical protein
MPIISSWGNKQYDLPWEMDQVSFLYDSKPGPEYYLFPMTGLLPVNRPSKQDLQNAPAPLWVTYIEPDSDIGIVDSKGDKTYIIHLPESFQLYLDTLGYDSRKEMNYVLRKCKELVCVENKKEDLLSVCSEHFSKINQRAIEEGEKPFSDIGISTLVEIFQSDCVHTISVYEKDNPAPIAINVSFQDKHKVFDSFCIRNTNDKYKKLSLGTFCILKNIEFAIRDNFKIYDMLAGGWGYKTKFGAVPTEMKVYIKCDREFAKHYEIPLEHISEIL